MRSFTVLFTLITAVIAAPSSLSTLGSLSAKTMASPSCKLPEAGNNCAGAARKDVIISYGKDATEEQRAMIMAAVTSSGSNIVYDWDDFGFSGFVPEPVAKLVEAHGKTFGLKMWENACTEIPWCGEAPC